MYSNYFWQTAIAPYSIISSVKRARNYYLYTQKNRILDLYQDAGQALYGHRPPRISQSLKNIIAQGLYSPYSSCYRTRLEKILRKLFPQMQNFGLYQSLERLGGTGIRQVFAQKPAESTNPDFLPPPVPSRWGKIRLWRPHSEVLERAARQSDLLIGILPLPGIQVILLIDQRQRQKAVPIPESDLISPLQIQGMIQAAANILFRPMYRTKDPIRWDLQSRLADTGIWLEDGPYLWLSKQAEPQYRELWQRAFAVDCLLPPSFFSPLHLPENLSSGEQKKLLGLLTERPCPPPVS